MVVVGGGVIGIEYASMFAALGTKVTVVEARPDAGVLRRRDGRGAPLPPARPGRRLPVRARVEGVEEHDGERGHAPGEREADPRRHPALRRGPAGATRSSTSTAGSRPTTRGRIAVDEHFRTVGAAHLRGRRRHRLPGLAATSMEQGRLARAHAFGERRAADPESLPIGIYTIPEISFVGKTEEQLTEEQCPTRSGSRATASWPAGRSSATPRAC